jgi:hypothetical protein
MKKISICIVSVMMFLNFSSITKAEIIETFCLIKNIDLVNANLNEEDYMRFAGKEINFLIDFDEKTISDISNEDEVSVITGMYGALDKRSFTKTNNGINYQNKIELKGDKKPEYVNYKYNNSVIFVDEKPKYLEVNIDQTGISFNKWKFSIECRDYRYSDQEKQKVKGKKQKDLEKILKNLPKKLEEINKEIKKSVKEKSEEVPFIGIKFEDIASVDDLLTYYKAKFFNNDPSFSVRIKKKYLNLNTIFITFENIKDLNEKEFFKLPLDSMKDKSKLRRLYNEFKKEKRKLN